MALHVMDEANRCLQCKNPRCRTGCPINTNIPEAIRLLKKQPVERSRKDAVLQQPADNRLFPCLQP